MGKTQIGKGQFMQVPILHYKILKSLNSQAGLGGGAIFLAGPISLTFYNK